MGQEVPILGDEVKQDWMRRWWTPHGRHSLFSPAIALLFFDADFWFVCLLPSQWRKGHCRASFSMIYAKLPEIETTPVDNEIEN